LTDEGLRQLQALKQLKVLSVIVTETTEKGIKRFHDAVPNCEIMDSLK
jgi:hypothetical protein